jgi:hypothetical protein
VLELLAVGGLVGFEPEPVGFGVEPVDERDPDLRRQLAGVGDSAQGRGPVAVVHGGVLHGVQLFGIDRPQPPIPGLVLERPQALTLGHLEQPDG